MGLFTLMACSEDAFQDAEQNGKPSFENQANSFNDQNSGEHLPDGTKYPGDPYVSPWDIWYNRGIDFEGRQPAYLFSSGNDENISPYTLQVFPYVGLAYYDGTNDGIYTDPSPGGSTSYNLTSGNYSTLYTNNVFNGISQEIGKLIRMQPITVNPQSGFRMEDKLDHLPLGNTPNYPQFPNGFSFPTGLSAQERDLLKDYGKVFFYEVNVFENGTFLGNYLLHPDIITLQNGTGAWEKAETSAGSGVQLQSAIPTLGTSVELFYYNANNGGTVWNENNPATGINVCDSREVVFRLPMSLSSHPITTGSVPKTLAIGFSQNPKLFWHNSSLDIVVY